MSINRVRFKFNYEPTELLYPLGHGSVVEGCIYAWREGKMEGKWRPCVLICTFDFMGRGGWRVLGLTSKAVYAHNQEPRVPVRWWSDRGQRESFIYSPALVPLMLKDIGAHIGEIGESEPEHIAAELGFPLFATYCRDLRDPGHRAIKSH